LTDYYKILGVLPEAEDIVIKAAYKALAQRYHPDKWSGDPAEANRRMAAINEAYGVLSDPSKRKQYDQSRSDAYQPDDETGNNDAAEGMASLTSDWELAVRYYPSLNYTLAALQRIDKTLGFTFMLILLENQSFSKSYEVAHKIETDYLKKYFGNDFDILAFAKELLLEGARGAAKELNRTVKVLGEDLRPWEVIGAISKTYNTKRYAKEIKEANAAESARQEDAKMLLYVIVGFFATIALLILISVIFGRR
jgi:DnaJ-domain-containing protein 1